MKDMDKNEDNVLQVDEWLDFGIPRTAVEGKGFARWPQFEGTATMTDISNQFLNTQPFWCAKMIYQRMNSLFCVSG